MNSDRASTVIVHSGALGDSVLLWPLLRALARSGEVVEFVARESHARLAAAEVAPGLIVPRSIDHPRWSALWAQRDQSEPRPEPEERVRRVVSFLVDEETPGGRLWFENARARFPNARVLAGGAPGSLPRQSLWRRARVEALGSVGSRINPDGPIVFHVGAGSPSKRWPLAQWVALSKAIRTKTTRPVRVLAGPVEQECWTPDERALFTALASTEVPRDELDGLPALADAIRVAALYIGADTGPTHLAAQLGVRTLALFGPTEPSVWRPIGPSVAVLAPTKPTPGMDWLAAETVEERVYQLTSMDDS